MTTTIQLSPAVRKALGAYSAQLRQDIPADVADWTQERFLGALMTDLCEQADWEAISLGGDQMPVGRLEET